MRNRKRSGEMGQGRPAKPGRYVTIWKRSEPTPRPATITLTHNECGHRWTQSRDKAIPDRCPSCGRNMVPPNGNDRPKEC